jgi:hypothetical protein
MSVRNWGKGGIITEYGTADALADDICPYRIETRPLFYDNGSHEGLDTGHRGVARVFDDGTVEVLGVVGGRWTGNQPREIVRDHIWPYVQAGAVPERVTELGGGARIAVQMRLPTSATVGHVEIRPLLTYADSFDGSTPSFLWDIGQIVVCENTFALAMTEAGKLRAKVRHTASLPQRMREVSDDLGRRMAHFLQTEVPAMRTLYDRGRDVTESEFKNYAKALLGSDDTDTERSGGRVGKAWDIFSRGNIGQTGNGSWDAWNSITEYLGHVAGRSPERRAWDTTAGAGANLGRTALSLAIATLT